MCSDQTRCRDETGVFKSEVESYRALRKVPVQMYSYEHQDLWILKPNCSLLRNLLVC